MTPILFHTLPSGRIEAMLGRHVVGEIVPWNMGSKVKAHYSIRLPVEGSPTMPRPATSLAMARSNMLFAIADWFDCAGPLFDGTATATRIQAEQERYRASALSVA